MIEETVEKSACTTLVARLFPRISRHAGGLNHCAAYQWRAMDIRFILLIFISLGNAVKAASMPALPPYRMPQWLTITEQAFKASSQVAYQQGDQRFKSRMWQEETKLA